MERDLRETFLPAFRTTLAAAIAVRKGTVLTCGNEFKSLTEAVKLGLVTEKGIDVALTNLMIIRFRLGMFDPPKLNRV